MPPYQTFALDDWIQRYAGKSKITLHDSMVTPFRLDELQALDPTAQIIAPDTFLTYANPRGKPDLRRNISLLYDVPGASGSGRVAPDDILVTSGAIAANHLILNTLLAPGDKVIAQHPTYNALIEVPRRVGASVHLWRQKPSESQQDGNGDGTEFPIFQLGVTELEAQIEAVRPKMVILNNPSNPTGAELNAEQLRRIVDACAKHDVMILCDEVFRFLHHDHGTPAPPSILQLDPPPRKCIVTSSVSKSFALPGIRVGWVVVSDDLRDTVLRQLATSSDYTAIAVGCIDQDITTFALSPNVKDQIMKRSKEACARNIEILMRWAERNKERVIFFRPMGAGTCVVRLRSENGDFIDDAKFVERLVEEEGIFAPPTGVCFGDDADGSGYTALKGGLRIGLGSDSERLRLGLEAIERLMKRWKE